MHTRPCRLLRPFSVFLSSAVLAAGLTTAASAEDGKIIKTWAIAEFGEPLYKDGFEHWPYANPDAPKGGSIVLGAFGSYDSFNPYILKGNWPTTIGLTRDSLMAGSGDEIGAAYGVIAESVEYPEDLSWVIFNIREEARYEDGSPIVADDFVYALDVTLEHGRPFLRSFYEAVEKYEALDDRRFKVTFNTTNDMASLMNASGLSPVPRRWWNSEGRDITKTTLEPPLASGAYTIAEADAGRSITYKRVENYWAADLPVNRGLNNIDEIRYDYYQDGAVMFEAFLAGKIDFRAENQSKRWAIGYDLPAVKDGRIVKRAEPDHTPQGVQAFFLNNRRSQFMDQRVREAFMQLYDFEAINKSLLYNAYKRTNSYFPNSEYGASGKPTPEEIAILEPYRDQLPPQVFTDTFVQPVTDGSGRNRRQVRQALKLLKEAGWRLDGGKLVDAQGQQMKVEFLMVQPSSERITAPFVQNLKKVGIDATMRLVDSSQYQVRYEEFDYDVISIRLNFFPPPGEEQRSYWGSAAADVRGSANIAGIKNPVVDALVEQIIEADDLPTLQATNRALDRVLLWGHYIIPTFYNDSNRLAYWNRFGRPEVTSRYSTGFPTSWWIDKGLDVSLIKSAK